MDLIEESKKIVVCRKCWWHNCMCNSPLKSAGIGVQLTINGERQESASYRTQAENTRHAWLLLYLRYFPEACDNREFPDEETLFKFALDISKACWYVNKIAFYRCIG